MVFADDLLEQAYHLLNKDGDPPKQASLRVPSPRLTTLCFIR